MAGRREGWRFETPFVSTEYRRTSRNNRLLELIFQDSNSVGFVSIAGIALFFFCLFLPDNNDSSALLQNQILPYNSTYPFTAERKEGNYKIFKIAVIADPDKSSRRDGKADTYYSELLHGTLRFNENKPEIDFSSKSIPLKSGYSLSGRGMELSDLTVYNGHLLTVDDRTGIVYQISDKSKMFPWQILADGNGLNEKGFKAEWMTVKDNYLFVGGMGKEYVLADGSIPHRNPEYVKEISSKGEVRHLNWISKYDAIRRAAGYEYPAYLLHESCNWSSHFKQWFFLPRRVSDQPYDEVLDENRCGNILIRADEDFKNIKITKVGELNTKRGFSAFRFIPNTGDKFIIATKTEENPNTKQMKSYVTVFDINGKVLLEQLIGENKFEGIEFL